MVYRLKPPCTCRGWGSGLAWGCLGLAESAPVGWAREPNGPPSPVCTCWAVDSVRSPGGLFLTPPSSSHRGVVALGS
eukprot:2579006-Prymnesium_polylepis.1